MDYVYLVILLALAVYTMFGVQVSLARVKHKIDAPTCVGHPEFERRFRIHQNTAEQLVIMIPASYLFALTISTLWAAILGAVFVVSRLVYMMEYVDNPQSRALGFGATFLVNVVLVVGALLGVGRGLLG